MFFSGIVVFAGRKHQYVPLNKHYNALKFIMTYLPQNIILFKINYILISKDA